MSLEYSRNDAGFGQGARHHLGNGLAERVSRPAGRRHFLMKDFIQTCELRVYSAARAANARLTARGRSPEA
jgi:hypothetical protein